MEDRRILGTHISYAHAAALVNRVMEQNTFNALLLVDPKCFLMFCRKAQGRNDEKYLQSLLQTLLTHDET